MALVSVREAARRLRGSPEWVQCLCDTGVIPFERVVTGGSPIMFIPEEAVKTYARKLWRNGRPPRPVVAPPGKYKAAQHRGGGLREKAAYGTVAPPEGPSETNWLAPSSRPRYTVGRRVIRPDGE